MNSKHGDAQPLKSLVGPRRAEATRSQAVGPSALEVWAELRERRSQIQQVADGSMVIDVDLVRMVFSAVAGDLAWRAALLAEKEKTDSSQDGQKS